MDERHDRSFHLLFSHPRMVRDLLRGFPPETWVEWLDLETLERVEPAGSGTSPGGLGQVPVWRTLWEGGSAWVYLLLRHQAEADPGTALSFEVHRGLLYQELARHPRHPETARPARPLPPVLPLVLHTGPEPWSAPREAFDLFMPLPASLHLYVPRGRYCVLDLPHVPLTGRAGSGNLVALLCELERSRTPGEAGALLDRLLDLTDGPEHAGLRRAWTDLLRDSLLPRRFPGLADGREQSLEEILLRLDGRRAAWTR